MLDPTFTGGVEEPGAPKASQSFTHLFAVVFHFLWKVLAILTYLLGNFYFSTDTATFIVCVLLLAFDFWTVKNVTGRLLVGLRWWNEIEDDGSSHWVFESLEDKSTINAWEATLFWIGLVVVPVGWTVFGLFNVLKPKWLTICVMAVASNVANMVGYFKCARDAKKQLKKMARGYVGSALVSTFSGAFDEPDASSNV